MFFKSSPQNLPCFQVFQTYPVCNPFIFQSIHSSEPRAMAINLPKQKKFLTNSQRQDVFQLLLKQSVDGKLKQGSITAAAAEFDVSKRTISRIWHDGVLQMDAGLTLDLSSKMPKVVGRKRLEIDLSKVADIPLRRRSTIRSLAAALGVPKSVVHRRIKEGVIRPHTNAIKPLLTEDNKKQRLAFCLSMISRSLTSATPMFDDMMDVIHIDEKWFYLSKASKRYYIASGEAEPSRTCKSKKFITKVMFLAAVARPRVDAVTNELFDGKIGIFPLTTLEPAKRSSKNRQRGTLETKAILSVTKAVTRSWLIQKLLPAIRSKWPQSHRGPIFIQQDNAKPHIPVDDADFVAAVEQIGLDIRLRFQPPNSPDLNVLDLGFFRAIQSLQEQHSLATIDDLIQAVEASFQTLPSHDLNKVFLTLQTCMKQILTVRGGNEYKLQHMAKERLIRCEGSLPLQLQCEQTLIDEACSCLE